MALHYMGFVVAGEDVVVLEAEIPDDADDPITIIMDKTWNLANGDRCAAYATMFQRCSDYLRERKIDKALIKASALPQSAAKLGLLESAELRGVVIAACASVCETKVMKKANISRTFGDRKVDEYLKDDDFWDEHVDGGKLRKGSREAAMLIVAARKRK
ncbi:hypothetical protein NPS29_00305 [Pseudomonas putida]|uniref:hypothetical protein n=1 Tax=Pseudomonas putida TaxID=303 RepID=UPI002363C038|nr:hypothetical protein [Pseudomonas putida]MDD1963752.1 hypothetical protein [Pseudomonas putida]